LFPLAIAQVALRWIPKMPDRSWSDFVWYALYFLIGYIFAAAERFTGSVKRYTWLCLALWIGAYVVVGSLVLFVLNYQPSEGSGFSGLYVVYVVSWTVISWSAVVFMLSLGVRHLNFRNRLLTYSNEAVLPFYLFHQTVILTVGWFVLPWDINNLVKYLVIVATSFLLIIALYEGVVRHIGFMRTLFGMAPLKR
jgi:glucan biosynthesis protein C